MNMCDLLGICACVWLNVYMYKWNEVLFNKVESCYVCAGVYAYDYMCIKRLVQCYKYAGMCIHILKYVYRCAGICIWVYAYKF